MTGLDNLPALAVFLALSSCAPASCGNPPGWVLAATQEPPPVPYTPNPVFYARETKAGTWERQGSTISLKQLLDDLAVAKDRLPRPLFLFDFADDQTCPRLEAIRRSIAKAARCSEDAPCSRAPSRISISASRLCPR